MRARSEIVVVGSGVIGMTTAFCLVRSGLKPVVISKDKLSETTSAVAAAFWYPYKAQPANKVASWAQASMSKYRELERVSATGIKWNDFSENLPPDAELPWWHSVVDNFRIDDCATDLPIGKRRVCYYSVPVVDTTLYLDYLRNALLDDNVEFVDSELSQIADAFEFGDTVVNCSGIGAMTLVEDHELHPARGQILRIKKKPGHRAIVDLTGEPKIAHVIPRTNDTILGGTYEVNENSLVPSRDEAAAIIERCRAILPALGNISDDDILGVACGLRPVRSTVRVEEEPHDRGRLFHNYGHGGAGFTLSWGCAEEILGFVRT